MIWACCFEKLLKVIHGLPRLAFGIRLSSGNELLIRVTDILIVITFIAIGGDHDLLGSPLRLPLVAPGTPLCTLVGCFGWCPPVAARSCLPTTLHENGPDRFLARGMPGGNVKEFLR
jgi:hypothetical protein